MDLRAATWWGLANVKHHFKSASVEVPAHILLSKSYLSCIYLDILINDYFKKIVTNTHTQMVCLGKHKRYIT